MISSRTSLGRTPRDRWYLFCEFVLTYFITSEYNYFSNRHTNRFLLQRKILSHTNSLTRLVWNKWVTREVLQNENAYKQSFHVLKLSAKLRTNFRNFGRETCREREMNSRTHFREIGSWRTCTWPAQTTKTCRTQSLCKNSYTLSQWLSRNFVRIFVLQNLSTERFFSNMTATETATEKVRYMYSTFLQVLQTDCRS